MMNTENWQALSELVQNKKGKTTLNEAYYVENVIRVLDAIIDMGKQFTKYRSQLEELSSAIKSCDFVIGELNVKHPSLDKYNYKTADKVINNKAYLNKMLDDINYTFNRYKMDSQKADSILTMLAKETKEKLDKHYNN